MSELGLPLVSIAVLCAGIIPIPMFIATWLYVNKTHRKQRLIELGYGTNNEWYRGKRIDFVEANWILPMMVVGSFVLRHLTYFIKRNKKPLQPFDLTPNLHNNENYLKLPKEFPFFYYWVLWTYFIMTFGMTVLFIGMGIDKGWFNF